MPTGAWARFESMVDAPSPAVLVTYRGDDTAHVSPVWFHFHDGYFEVVIAENDVKLRHLCRRPECTLVVFETTPPFRGIRVEGTADLRPDTDATVRRSIATRYLGEADGAAFVAQRHTPGVVLRLGTDQARTWDLSTILP